MFTFAVRMTVVTRTENRGDKVHVYQKETFIPTFDRQDAEAMAQALSNGPREYSNDPRVTSERTFSPVAIMMRHNGDRLERTAFTFDELNEIADAWTAPTPRIRAV